MHLSLEKAKNGELTAKYDNLYLHSSYNPLREAERFVNDINLNYIPPYIIITEPGIGYCIPLLHKRFPKSKIVIIRYTEELSEYNKDADYIINYFDKKTSISKQLLNIISEEDLINSLFLQWPSSSRIFVELESHLLNEIKLCFNNAKTLLITREYFEKKWLLNTISFTRYADKILVLKKIIDIPILIISSGPSLKPVINTIKQYKNNFFIITLSSAISVCIENEIIPDLLITTDGGFWAGQHLKSLNKINIPIATPLEGYMPRQLLKKLNILPLNYGDGLSSEIIKNINLKTIFAERNGTVSGTAIKFAIDYSNNDIFFCGLDMSNQKGFQHTQPNENELNNSIKDNLINNSEKRAVKSQYSSGVLDIYKEWFVNLKIKNRNVYRIIDDKYKNNKLGEIKDIDSTTFSELSKSLKPIVQKNTYFEKTKWEKNLTKEKQLIYTLSNNIMWNKLLYPLSMATLVHDKNNLEIINRIEKENKKLFSKIGKLLND